MARKAYLVPFHNYQVREFLNVENESKVENNIFLDLVDVGHKHQTTNSFVL